MKLDFLSRSLRKLGKRMGQRLIDAEKPADLFKELAKYRAGGTESNKGDGHRFLSYALSHWQKSHSQMFQDLFVAQEMKEKRQGFFVEFGATDGVSMSNTIMLEREFAWEGIVAEPARMWHTDLLKNRRCVVDTRCVWKTSGEQIEFNETSEGALSTIDVFSNADGHAPARENGTKYLVDTVSLNDLLLSYNAPSNIDYLSIDTEGSELSILGAFDFNVWNVKLITVEHNYTELRNDIFSLLSKHRYTRVLEGFSQWDDWYIKDDSHS